MSTELAWAAGFFDGEGCFSVIKRKNQEPNLVISITQADVRPLKRFAKIVNLGIRGPIFRKDSGFGQKGHYLVRTSGKEAWRVAHLLMPYLSEPKKEQYQSCLDRGARVW